MLVFNEGLPRAGKSYDVVKNHILPAISAGRRVYARLNGLDDPERRRRIADYVGVELSRLDDLLIHVSTQEVCKIFRAERNASGEWVIPDALKDCLFVVDECHTFYVASTQPIAPALEEFFALIGQNGGDGVLMTQFYRRLHSSVRGRIERKNVFQKLTAVGMDGSYTVTRYHATAPDRFEKVSSSTEKYDPAIFPLYQGYADGAANRQVYKGGGQTVWRVLAKHALWMVPLVVFAVFMLVRFFGGHVGVGKSHLATVPPVSALDPSGAYARTAGAAVDVVTPKPSYGGLTEEQAYVFRMSDRFRARLAGLVTAGSTQYGVVEWGDGTGPVSERLSFDQLRALGVEVSVERYGVRLSAGKRVVVATPWPLNLPVASTSGADSGPSSDRPARESVVTPLTQWPGGSGIGRAAYVPPELLPHEDFARSGR